MENDFFISLNDFLSRNRCVIYTVRPNIFETFVEDAESKIASKFP